MTDWIIAIPSYHRSQSIKENTLRVLDECNIPHSCIKVFVSKEEVPVYRASLPEDIEVIESVVGCIENRANIREYYPEGQKIVYMDDDLRGFYTICDFTDEHTTCHIFDKKNLKEAYYKKQVPLLNLDKFIRTVFETLEKENAYLAGIYPLTNGFFASHRVTTDLKYICGFCYFERNRKDFKLEGYAYAEDYERTCAVYTRDKKILRFEYVMAKSYYYKGKGDSGKSGGLVETRTVELSKQAQEKLVALYPECVTLVPPTKNNKFWNLKVIKQKN